MSSVYHLGMLEKVMLLACLEVFFFFRFSICKMKVFKKKQQDKFHVEYMSTLSLWSMQNPQKHREHLEQSKQMLGLGSGRVFCWDFFLFLSLYEPKYFFVVHSKRKLT